MTFPREVGHHSDTQMLPIDYARFYFWIEIVIHICTQLFLKIKLFLSQPHCQQTQTLAIPNLFLNFTKGLCSFNSSSFHVLIQNKDLHKPHFFTQQKTGFKNSPPTHLVTEKSSVSQGQSFHCSHWELITQSMNGQSGRGVWLLST